MSKLPKNHIELAGRVRLGERGQIVVPAEVREKLGLEPGDHLLALHIPDSEAIAFVPENRLNKLIEQSGGKLAQAIQKITGNKK